MKRIIAFVSTLLLSLSSLFVINISPVFAATITWNGSGGDNLFSTPTNWIGGVAPVNGDSITFPKISGSYNTTLQNDLGASVCFNGIAQEANDPGNGGGYIITGDTALEGTYSGGDITSLKLNGAISLCGNLTIADNSNLYFGNYDYQGTVNLSSYDIDVNSVGTNYSKLYIYSILTGSGSIGSGISSVLFFLADSPSFSGTIDAGAQVLVYKPIALGTGNIDLSSGGSLSVCFQQEGTINNNITLGGSIKLNLQCQGGNAKNVNISGTITLIADTTSAVFGATLAIIGPLHGNYKIEINEPSTGVLKINSPDNTSKTSNGNYEVPYKTITVPSDSIGPNVSVDVSYHKTYIINGIRGDTTVDGGGVLKGSGTVGVLNIASGGTVAPGQSPGCLNTGNLTEGGTYSAEIGGTTACTDYDQLNVTGTVDVTNGTLTTSLYNGFKPVKDQSYIIINNDGADAVTGTFNALPEGATFEVAGYVFKISYVGGDGNDVVLTVQSVPGAPDTGFQSLTTNPMTTLAATVLLTSGIALLSRRYNKITAKK